MVLLANGEGPSGKSVLTRGLLPKYIDAKQIPSKKKPFSTIDGSQFSHTVYLILSEELYDGVWEQIQSKIDVVKYSRVIMPLSALLEDQFFNSYIKSGNIAMLSDGRAGVDNLYSLKDGLLRLELPKELYERTGLVGTAISDGGRKHVKSRYAIEINLRLPSMVHGKNGFDRIVWAFKNVLNSAVTWLFLDFNRQNDSTESSELPIARHRPTVSECQPVANTTAVLAPQIKLPLSGESDEEQFQVPDWLSLVALGSPRIHPEDTIDQYLCRDQVPDRDQASVTRTVKVTWQGFMSPEWVKNLYLQTFWACRGHPGFWFALTVNNLETEASNELDGYTILTMPDKSYGPTDDYLARYGFAVWEMTCFSGP